LDEYCQNALYTAELAFSRLEAKAELAFEHLMQQILTSQNCTTKKLVTMERHELETLRRFFAFIRYRNSAQYNSMVSKFAETVTWENRPMSHGMLLSVWHRHRVLTSIHAFLNHDSVRSPAPDMASEDVNRYCWSFLGADLYLGVASEGQEFVMTDNCIGNLDECFRGDP
jgi:hypothetical protein